MNSAFSDIIIQQNNSSWPLAYGWWLVILMCISVALFVFYKIKKIHAQNRLKKQAIKQLKVLPTGVPLYQLSGVLKQVLIGYCGREKIAPAHQQEMINIWTEQFNRQPPTELTDWLNSLYLNQYKAAGTVTSQDLKMAIKLIQSCHLKPKEDANV